MRISDWSSDVCSSDLRTAGNGPAARPVWYSCWYGPIGPCHQGLLPEQAGKPALVDVHLCLVTEQRRRQRADICAERTLRCDAEHSLTGALTLATAMFVSDPHPPETGPIQNTRKHFWL